eukprot:TRINITY_DN1241_c2_g1_i2.p1 TRINITY_DN1241_c2_g1~~TRINITY_DN1241_c2_g1_i2.p1  ORF type:complete len:682 (-),score=125.15 TRINITY_DN1241_c2_g1_i2:79-2124(-)
MRGSASVKASGSVRPAGSVRGLPSLLQYANLASVTTNNSVHASQTAATTSQMPTCTESSVGGHLSSHLSSEPSSKLSERIRRTAACSVDADILRAVRVHKILGRVGRVFLESAGSQDTYGLSENVKAIDHFWSHSWSAKPVHKICTLIFFYNGGAAAVASVAAALLMAALMQAGVVPGNLCLDWGCRNHTDCEQGFCESHGRCFPHGACGRFAVPADGICLDESHSPPFIYWPLPMGLIVYIIVLIRWRPRCNAFLDKVCIHQTDVERKRRGIEGLGGFLRNSRQMVLLWDKTYALRLWCVFELAAFTYVTSLRASAVPSSWPLLRRAESFIWRRWRGSEMDHIVMLPVLRGFGIAIGASAVLLVHVLYSIIPLVTTSELLELVLPVVVAAAAILYLVHIARAWARDRYELRRQLSHFNVHNAGCWCCKVGHVNPETGAPVDCDRLLIYEAIRAWFDGGPAAFQQTVRERLYGEVEAILPGMLRFRDAVYMALPTIWFEISKLGGDCLAFQFLNRRLLWILAICISWNPLIFGVVMWLSAFACKKRERCDWLVTVGVAVVVIALRQGTQEAYRLIMQFPAYVSLPFILFVSIVAKLLLMGVGLNAVIGSDVCSTATENSLKNAESTPGSVVSSLQVCSVQTPHQLTTTTGGAEAEEVKLAVIEDCVESLPQQDDMMRSKTV